MDCKCRVLNEIRGKESVVSLSEDANIGKGEVRIGPGVMLPKSALVFSFARSSGPGGQSVNKLNTKAYLHVKLQDLAEVLGAEALELSPAVVSLPAE